MDLGTTPWSWCSAFCTSTSQKLKKLNKRSPWVTLTFSFFLLPGCDEHEHKVEHPYGTTFLCLDNESNRQRFGPDGVGSIQVQYRRSTRRRSQRATLIHMLVASFRDRLCPWTLDNAFRKAEHPDRIFVRIIDQTVAGGDKIDDAGYFMAMHHRTENSESLRRGARKKIF